VIRVRGGFGLVELIVALTIISIALVGLAGAAAVAHRSFMSAEAIERGAEAAAFALDSLMRVETPVAGERRDSVAHVRWTIIEDSAAVMIALTVDVARPLHARRLDFQATHHAR
jgi:prepilin-type N-terminal cleavage/methylation domain-containing protein